MTIFPQSRAGMAEGRTFSATVTLQAVHELRHQTHGVTLHAAVRGLLGERGVYLVCDHYVGDLSLDDARRHAEDWCRVVAGGRIHGTTRRSRKLRCGAAQAAPFDVRTWIAS